MKLRCLHNGFLFVLLQETNAKGAFIEKTRWGFELTPGSQFQGKDHGAFNAALEIGRWAKILTIGPDCEEIKVGDYVCVEPQMWSNAFTHDGVKIRKSDESKVMLIADEKPNLLF